jgi:hypothetical protein
VTTNFFPILGAEAAMGRTLGDDEDQPGAPAAILISWGLFQRRFGGDPAIVGQRVTVNGQPTTVVGVMPESFRLLLPSDAAVPDRRSPCRRNTPRTVLAAGSFDERVFDEYLREASAPTRFAALLAICFAGAAVLLAAVGVFGIATHAVVQRRAEFGVRLALGARPGQLLALVFREHAKIAVLGLWPAPGWRRCRRAG